MFEIQVSPSRVNYFNTNFQCIKPVSLYFFETNDKWGIHETLVRQDVQPVDNPQTFNIYSQKQRHKHNYKFKLQNTACQVKHRIFQCEA